MAKGYRIRCPRCGEVADYQTDGYCAKCGTPLHLEELPGMIQIYRMGSPLGVAVGFGIYIDEVPYGYVGNRETVKIRVPMGRHLVHVAQGMSRRCKDIAVTLSPAAPNGYLKVHMRMGFVSNTFIIEPANPSEMPAEG